MKIYISLSNVDLPEVVIKAWKKIADMQRGKPEQAMLDVQWLGGGVMNVAVEHVGDLIHRMTEGVEYGDSGQEFVIEKCKKILRYLRNEYGFIKEFRENQKNNAKAKNKSLEEYTKEYNKALEVYKKEHSKIPVYNEVQWLAQSAAISLANLDIDKTIKFLERLLFLFTKNDQVAFDYKLDDKEHLLKYT